MRVRPASSSRMRFAIVAACCCSTPGSGSATTSSMPTTASRPAVSPTSWPRPGSRWTTSPPSSIATSMSTTPARTPLPRHPDLRPAGRMGDRPHDRPHDPRLDRFPRRRLSADRRRSRARRRYPGRGDAGPHGRPSVARRGDRRAATSSSPARPSTPGEWAGDPDAREGRSRAPDQEAYDRSVERLKALDPVEVAFRPRPRGLASADPDDAVAARRYPSRAVLGGELAVPCTCNPL